MRHADPSDPRVERPAFGRRGRRAAAPLVIEGEAVLLSSRSGRVRPATASEPAATPAARPAPAPRLAPRKPPLDLIFSGLAAASGASPVRRGSRPLGALPLAGGAAAGLVAMAAVAFAAIPSAAPTLAVAGLQRGAVSVSEVVARVGSRNEGEVLSVEGLIRNAGKVPAAVPPLKLSLFEPDGAVRAKPVVPLARPLAPGEVLRFQTMVAVPKGSVAAGALDLGFWEPLS